MAKTAADILVENIIDWGIDIVFGMPGDGINGIMEALRTRQDKVRFVQVRHEESAAFMACAYAGSSFRGSLNKGSTKRKEDCADTLPRQAR